MFSYIFENDFWDEAPHLVTLFFGFEQGFLSGGGDFKEPLASTASFAGGAAEFGFEETFFFEPDEGGMHDGEDDLALGDFVDFVGDGDAVGVVLEYSYGQQHQFFEFADVCSFHSNMIIKCISNEWIFKVGEE